MIVTQKRSYYLKPIKVYIKPKRQAVTRFVAFPDWMNDFNKKRRLKSRHSSF